MFIFRNYTIENLFPEDVRFSGYGDISDIPADGIYVWFYTVPVNPDPVRRLEEVRGTGDKLQLVASRIPQSSQFYILTLEDLFPTAVDDTEYALRDAIREVNDISGKLGEAYPNIRLIDFSGFLRRHKPEEWINWKFYFLSQMIVSPSLAPGFRQWWSDRMAYFGRTRKKCLVLDLDNTLWDGVLGEDGISGVRMSGDYPGNAFMYFQEGLVTLSKSGVILTVCSKNNEADVRDLWDKNPFVKLKPEFISAYRINWRNKADNIRELAEELNIGLDSMVFVDDNPSERELVRQELPMVAVPDFPKRPYGLMSFYQALVRDYFETYRLTAEDLDKTEQYRANARRASEQALFTDLTDFIRSLDIQITVTRANEFNVPRIAQMSQKTNQFNLTTRRYTEADISTFTEAGDDVYCISVKDRFGDNGITGAVIIRRSGETAGIDTFLLSCRILGKDIEKEFLKAILNRLYEEDVRRVEAIYIPTLKNSQVADFYDRMGFELQGEEAGVRTYSFDLDKRLELSDSYTLTFE